jgi:predicted DNA-binding protein (MmcQ/YjbR family)
MHVEDLRKYCLTFEAATENLQWGDDLCFKIRGKIFTILSLTSIPPKVCFKCTPDMFSELIEMEDIRPAPYVGRYKWVLLERLDALPAPQLRELIAQSFEMVSAKASKPKKGSRRPKQNARRR